MSSPWRGGKAGLVDSSMACACVIVVKWSMASVCMLIGSARAVSHLETSRNLEDSGHAHALNTKPKHTTHSEHKPEMPNHKTKSVNTYIFYTQGNLIISKPSKSSVINISRGQQPYISASQSTAANTTAAAAASWASNVHKCCYCQTRLMHMRMHAHIHTCLGMSPYTRTRATDLPKQHNTKQKRNTDVHSADTTHYETNHNNICTASSYISVSHMLS